MSQRSIERRPGLAMPAALAALVTLGACTSSAPRAPEGADAARRPADAEAAPQAVPEAVRRDFEAALAALEAERFDEAEQRLESLAAEQPAYPGPHVNLALVYERDGREAEARAALENALEIDPDHAQANNELGILLRRAGEFEAAEAAYRRALATDPDYALAHHNLGVLLDLYLHRGAEALEHYERYQALMAEPDRKVAGWIIDLRRRVGSDAADTARVAQEDGS